MRNGIYRTGTGELVTLTTTATGYLITSANGTVTTVARSSE